MNTKGTELARPGNLPGQDPANHTADSSLANKQQRKKGGRGDWLITIPLVVVGVAYLYFWFLPNKREISALHQELEMQRITAAQAPVLQAEMTRANDAASVAEEFTQAWRSTAPQQGRVAPIFGQISDAVQQSGGRTTAFDPQPDANMAQLRQTKLNLSFQGDFQTTFEVLRKIEALGATIWVESLQIDAASKSGEQALSEVSLAIFSEIPERTD